MIRRPPRSPLFPSTPLFRSGAACPQVSRLFLFAFALVVILDFVRASRGSQKLFQSRVDRFDARDRLRRRLRTAGKNAITQRSEEHTSELQSLAYLVCRLLLE